MSNTNLTNLTNILFLQELENLRADAKPSAMMLASMAEVRRKKAIVN